MLNCPNCEFADFDKDKCKRLLIRLPHVCPYAVERKPRNHFDEIKAMSMEEMAEWVSAITLDEFGDKKDWLNWLKEEI